MSSAAIMANAVAIAVCPLGNASSPSNVRPIKGLRITTVRPASAGPSRATTVIRSRPSAAESEARSKAKKPATNGSPM